MTATLNRRSSSTPTPPAKSPRPSAARPKSILAEAALTAMTLAAAVDLARLFKTPGKVFVPVACTAVVVHAVCAGVRRRGLGLAIATPAAVVAGGLVLAWTVFPKRTTAGVPTRATWHAAGHALSTAVDLFRTASPPAPAAAGFILACGVGCAMTAYLSDWAAFRTRAAVEACLPSLSLFVFSATLAHGRHNALAAGVWLAAFLGFLLVSEAGVDQPRSAWFASRGVRGPAAVLQTGAIVLVTAVLLAVVVGPQLPGATSRAVIDLRNSGGPGSDARLTTNPHTDIRARLTDRSDVEVFSVSSNQAAYWRQTSLDHFDGSGWSLSDSYGGSKGPLPSGRRGSDIPTAGTSPEIVADFSISRLEAIWLPTPYRPVRYNGPGKVSYSASSGSLIVDQPTSDGLNYQITAVDPTPDPATLRNAGPPSDDPTLATDLSLPRLPREVIDTAIHATAGATTAYDKALKLQNYFRDNFRYSLSVPPDDSSTDAVVSFLHQKAGFCQQFSGAYAVMARLLGLPSRVAVGFTPGEFGPDGRYHVRNLHAHAWPEVYFAGTGWVLFEPTPLRGAPGAQRYTGVAPQQANQPPAISPTTAIESPTTIAAPLPVSPRPLEPSGGIKPNTTPSWQADVWGAVVAWRGLIGGLSAVLLLAGITPFAMWMRRRRRHNAIIAAWPRSPNRATPTVELQPNDLHQRPQDDTGVPASCEVMLAWDDTREHLSMVGAPLHNGDTPAEYATRATHKANLPPLAAGALFGLADDVVAVSYAGSELDDESAGRARAACATIVRATRDQMTPLQRLIAAIDPRQLRRR